MISAKEAAERSKKRREEIAVGQLKEISDKIEEICDTTGNTNLTCQGKLISEVKEGLEKEGYEVRYDFGEQEYTCIFW